jgi:hypothetical protein
MLARRSLTLHRLAGRTIERRSIGEDDLLDARVASWAGFTFSTVHVQLASVLALEALGVAVVSDGCASVADRVVQHLSDRAVEGHGLTQSNVPSRSLRMNLRDKECFGRIDVPDSGDATLVQ